jgi:hypothetical protein
MCLDSSLFKLEDKSLNSIEHKIKFKYSYFSIDHCTFFESSQTFLFLFQFQSLNNYCIHLIFYLLLSVVHTLFRFVFVSFPLHLFVFMHTSCHASHSSTHSSNSKFDSHRIINSLMLCHTIQNYI